MSNTFFERSVPEHYGIRSGDISDFIDALCGHPSGQETHSFMIIRHGTVISEGYFYPYTADKAHTVYSITKAFLTVQRKLDSSTFLHW